MFASKVADYLDDDLIGTDRTHAVDAYDTRPPALPAHRRAREAPQGPPGAARRRPDRAVRGRRRRRLRLLPHRRRAAREYVVAVNNAAKAKTVTFATGSARPSTASTARDADASDRSGTDKARSPSPSRRCSAIVLQADRQLAAPATKPSVTLTAPRCRRHRHRRASPPTWTADGLDRVVFAAQVGNGPWQTLGSADHAPYKVTQTSPGSPPEPPCATRRWSSTAPAAPRAPRPPPRPDRRPPAEKPSAVDRDYAVVHYQRPDGDYADWSLYAWGDIADGEAPPGRRQPSPAGTPTAPSPR